ncbi:MAG: hypothetical protein IJ911_04210 [Salinivirgaceae bacterium]|nr:hypothetical protein [Salinivirgaceae bacterium]
MGLTRKTSPRVWKTMGDTEFQGNSEIWRKFNGTTFCRSGAEKLDADDNKEGDHPTFCQIWFGNMTGRNIDIQMSAL